MREQQKFINHNQLGLPVRLPPYLRKALNGGSPWGSLQLGMISQSPVIGQRTTEDTLQNNFGENVRLRKVARNVSGDLTGIAESWGINRFCTVVHGSLARGLVRLPSNGDSSDVDIDLIIDGNHVSKEKRAAVRQWMYESLRFHETRIDTYVFTTEEVKRNNGDYARLYLGSSAYPLANEGCLWEDIVFLGIFYEAWSSQSPHVKKKLRKVLPLLSSGASEKDLRETLGNGRVGICAFNFLSEFGLIENPGSYERIKKLI